MEDDHYEEDYEAQMLAAQEDYLRAEEELQGMQSQALLEQRVDGEVALGHM